MSRMLAHLIQCSPDNERSEENEWLEIRGRIEGESVFYRSFSVAYNIFLAYTASINLLNHSEKRQTKVVGSWTACASGRDRNTRSLFITRATGSSTKSRRKKWEEVLKEGSGHSFYRRELIGCARFHHHYFNSLLTSVWY